MKTFLIAFLLFMTPFIIKSQFIYFNEEYNNDLNSGATGIYQTGEGYIIGGWSVVEENDESTTKVLVSKIDPDGNQLSWKTFGEKGWQYNVSQSGGFTRLSGGGYTICGTIYNGDLYGTFLMRFDQNGDSLWARTYGDPAPLEDTLIVPLTCRELPDKGLIMTGWIDNRPGGSNIFLMRTDSLGNSVWFQQYGVGDWTEVGSAIAFLPDGGFLIGTTRYFAPLNTYQADAGLLKTDSLGNMIWLKYFGGEYEDWSSCVTMSQDGNYLVSSVYAVYQDNTDFPEQRAWIFKTDTAGNVLWERTYARCNFFGFSTCVEELNNGDIIISGQASYTDGFGTFGYILKTNSIGDSLWMHDYFIYPQDVNLLNNLQMTSDGGMILTGCTIGPPLHTQSVWVEKLDDLGQMVGVEENGSMGSSVRGSLVVWPNPASGVVNVMCSGLSSGKEYAILVYDVFGREMIATEVTSAPEGGGQVECLTTSGGDRYLDVSSLPPGFYVVILKDQRITLATKKFVVSR
jgi:hypothetical protein